MFSFILHNFSHVGPILGAAAFGLVILLERTSALVWAYPFRVAEPFFERLRFLIMDDNIPDALALCERYASKPAVRVVKEGLLRAHQPENLIEHGLQLAVSRANEEVQARTPFLSTIANVATLFGLFGTILGLVQSFEAVGNANAQERAALLANGISTAMNATMLGLGVAIPCMIFYSYLMSRTNRLNAEVEQAAIRVMDLLKQRYYAEQAEGAVPGGAGRPVRIRRL